MSGDFTSFVPFLKDDAIFNRFGEVLAEYLDANEFSCTKTLCWNHRGEYVKDPSASQAVKLVCLLP